MELALFQVDAFTDQIFEGNSACVVPLTAWPDDQLLLHIARENAVAETAFFVPHNDHYHIRWFTPDIEMDLCGHATLATAHVLKSHLAVNTPVIRFKSKSGELNVRINAGSYTLDFPSRMPSPAALPELIKQGFELPPLEVLKSRDYILVYANETDIRKMNPDRQVLDKLNLDPGGIIITSPGLTTDFVSRFFTTQSTIFEDPVTGSAHCSLIPFWSQRLGKKEMTALQVSDRGGKLWCNDAGERVLITGNARTYMRGTLWTE